MFNSDVISSGLWNCLADLVAPGSQLYWPFVLSAAGIALLIYFVRDNRNEGGNLERFLSFCFPGRIYRHPSALLDFRYFLVNTIVYGAFIGPLLLTSSSTAVSTAYVLIKVAGEPPSSLLPGGIWADIAVTVAAVVFADIGFFVSHWLQHRVGFLWEFHKVHHAAEVLHPLTLYRRHPVDAALDAVLMGAAAGIVLGISGFLFDDSVKGLTILGTNAALFVFHFAGVHLRHSHIRLSFGFLDRIFISPTLHQVHHGCSPQHVDKNFGGIFSVWDWLAGTLYLPRNDEELVLGLTEGEHHEYNSIARLYLLPFVKVAIRMQRLVGSCAIQGTRFPESQDPPTKRAGGLCNPERIAVRETRSATS
jgi:sterol desaturase/sphingolipid hydroxylase (fatty acid hydroxylase superfamily)